MGSEDVKGTNLELRVASAKEVIPIAPPQRAVDMTARATRMARDFAIVWDEGGDWEVGGRYVGEVLVSKT